MRRPAPRGPLSEAVLETLTAEPGRAPTIEASKVVDVAVTTASTRGSVLADDDLQLTLFLLYELHYRGIDGVDDAWE